jgi:hypothetical protein
MMQGHSGVADTLDEAKAAFRAAGDGTRAAGADQCTLDPLLSSHSIP